MPEISKVVVTIKTLPHHREQLQAAAPQAEFIYACPNPGPAHLAGDKLSDEQLASADAILGVIAPAELKKAENLKLLQLSMAGSDAFAAPGVLPEGVALANASGGYGVAIAEHLMAMLLSLCKRLPQYRDRQPDGKWEMLGQVRGVYGSTVLVVGLGDIGGEFAKRAKALGAYVIGVRRKGLDKPDYVDELHLSDKLDELIPRADFIALCLPNTPATTRIFNRERIFSMKPDSILLNIGRGTAIDQEALCDALDSGLLWGAGVDVTDPEPLPPDHRMWKTNRLLLTPHVSGFFSLEETRTRIVNIMAENLSAFIAGKPLKNIVDPETGYRRLVES